MHLWLYNWWNHSGWTHWGVSFLDCKNQQDAATDYGCSSQEKSVDGIEGVMMLCWQACPLCKRKLAERGIIRDHGACNPLFGFAMYITGDSTRLLRIQAIYTTIIGLTTSKRQFRGYAEYPHHGRRNAHFRVLAILLYWQCPCDVVWFDLLKLIEDGTEFLRVGHIPIQ